MKGSQWHTAPDGRRFVVFAGRCVCASLAGCWQARCECGEHLTKHGFDPASAKREALDAMGRAEEHGSCSASRQPQLEVIANTQRPKEAA